MHFSDWNKIENLKIQYQIMEQKQYDNVQEYYDYYTFGDGQFQVLLILFDGKALAKPTNEFLFTLLNLGQCTITVSSKEFCEQFDPGDFDGIVVAMKNYFSLSTSEFYSFMLSWFNRYWDGKNLCTEPILQAVICSGSSEGHGTEILASNIQYALDRFGGIRPLCIGYHNPYGFVYIEGEDEKKEIKQLRHIQKYAYNFMRHLPLKKIISQQLPAYDSTHIPPKPDWQKGLNLLPFPLVQSSDEIQALKDQITALKISSEDQADQIKNQADQIKNQTTQINTLTTSLEDRATEIRQLTQEKNSLIFLLLNIGRYGVGWIPVLNRFVR